MVQGQTLVKDKQLQVLGVISGLEHVGTGLANVITHRAATHARPPGPTPSFFLTASFPCPPPLSPHLSALLTTRQATCQKDTWRAHKAACKAAAASGRKQQAG